MAAMSGRATADDAKHRVAVGQGLRQPLEHHRRHPFATAIAIRFAGEAFAAAIGR